MISKSSSALLQIRKIHVTLYGGEEKVGVGVGFWASGIGWYLVFSYFNLINAQYQDQLLLGPSLPSLGRGVSGYCDKVKLTGARF